MGRGTIRRRPGVAPRYWRVLEPEALELLRRVFHHMNRGMILLWRTGLGRMADVWPRGFGRLMVIEHRGRRSGTQFRTPVNYTIADHDLYCIAAFGAQSDWYRDLLTVYETAVWLPDGRWEVSVADVSDNPRRIDLMRSVLIDSGFAAHLFGLNPRRITDEDLAEATTTYRLLRFGLIRPAPTQNGPGDLAWIWIPIGAAVAAVFAGRARSETRDAPTAAVRVALDR